MLMALDVSNMNIDIGVMDGYDIKYRFKMATNSMPDIGRNREYDLQILCI